MCTYVPTLKPLELIESCLNVSVANVYFSLYCDLFQAINRR